MQSEYLPFYQIAGSLQERIANGTAGSSLNGAMLGERGSGRACMPMVVGCPGRTEGQGHRQGSKALTLDAVDSAQAPPSRFRVSSAVIAKHALPFLPRPPSPSHSGSPNRTHSDMIALVDLYEGGE